MSGKKNKMKRKEQLKEDKSNSGQAELEKRMEKSGAKTVDPPAGQVKMSEVIQSFAEPLLKNCQTDDQVKFTIRLSILVWNSTLIPESKKGELLEDLLSQVSYADDPKTTEAMTALINMLIERKQSMFADVDNAIVDVQFSGSGDNLRFEVAYNPS